MKFEKISWVQYTNDFIKFYNDDNYDDIYNSIKLPERSTEYSAGYDFYAPFDIVLKPNQTIKFPTGIRALLDNDKFLAIYPRSGLGFKYMTQFWNTVGIIDSDYARSDNEGHIWIKLRNSSPNGKTVTIKKGQAVCQGIIQQYFVVDNDNASGIRNGGFGSTTK